MSATLDFNLDPTVNPKKDAVFSFKQRPVIDISVLCKPIPGLPTEICIVLPGGYKLCPAVDRINISQFRYALKALNMANGALAPLGPVFLIIDFVLSLFKLVTAFLDAIGPPPDPTKWKDALKQCINKAIEIAKLSPPFAFPIMLLAIFDMLILSLEGAAQEMSSLALLAGQIQQAQANSAQAPGLLPLISCSKASLAQQMENVEHLFASLNGIVDLINIFAKIAQIKSDAFPIKLAPRLPPEPLIAAALLREIADTLMKVRQKIPV